MKTNGPGKYDKALSKAIKFAGANQGILIIIDGKDGGGFSVQAELDVVKRIPDMLENLAKQIRADNQRNGL
jgi:hypothetical protein